MWSDFVAALQAQLANQMVAGAVALGLVGVIAASLRNLPAMLWGQAKRAFVVTATLDSRNDLFVAFVAWLNDQRFGQRSRWFTVIQAPPSVEDDANATDDAPRLQFSPAPGFHLFWYRGRLMWMQRELSMNLQVVETVHLAALFGTRQLMEDLLQGVARHAGERRANRLMLYAVDSWSDNWRLADSKPRRSLDSVVLEAGVAKRLHDDIHEFFSRREWYGRMGVPWRRGYLLYGPPGTGKTSVAYALAGELHLKLCAMSLSNAKLTDQMLANQLQNTPPRSLILIEDIDAFFNARDKQDTRITISFSGLLNALDGVGAQEGRIIVLTTNHRERLDPALIRPGRIDVEIELGNADAHQLQGMLLRFFPDAQAHATRLVADYPDGALSPAQIQKLLIAASSAAQAEAHLRTAFASSLPAVAVSPGSSSTPASTHPTESTPRNVHGCDAPPGASRDPVATGPTRSPCSPDPC